MTPPTHFHIVSMTYPLSHCVYEIPTCTLFLWHHIPIFTLFLRPTYFSIVSVTPPTYFHIVSMTTHMYFHIISMIWPSCFQPHRDLADAPVFCVLIPNDIKLAVETHALLLFDVFVVANVRSRFSRTASCSSIQLSVASFMSLVNQITSCQEGRVLSPAVHVSVHCSLFLVVTWWLFLL